VARRFGVNIYKVLQPSFCLVGLIRKDETGHAKIMEDYIMNSTNRGLLLLLVPILCFSTYEVVSKMTNNLMPPMQINFLRFLIGGLILLPLAIADLRAREITLSQKDWLLLLFLGILNVTISMNLVQYGIQMTKASLAAMIFSSNPLFVSLFAAFILGEKFSIKKISGLVGGLVGVFIALLNGRASNQGEFYLGALLLLLGAISFAIFTVLTKKIIFRLGNLATNAFSFLLGCLAIVPILAANHQAILTFDLRVLPQILYLSIIVTGVGYLCYFKALSMLDTSLGSMTFFVKPILASVFAAFFLHEAITFNLMIGIAIVILSVVWVKQVAVKE
jgi:drug/metabolite transporter (DMT)-like permease